MKESKEQDREPIPGCETFQETDFYIIRRRWFSHLVWVWILVAVFSIFQQFAVGEFSLLLSGVALFFGVYTVACLVNFTDIKMNAELLLVETAPISFGGRRAVFPENISVFEVCTHRFRGGKNYEIEITLIDGRKVSLLRSILNKDQAGFICDSLSRFYLKNRQPSPGDAKIK